MLAQRVVWGYIRFKESRLTCLRLKNPFLSQLGRYKDSAITREVSFIPWMIPSSFLLHGPFREMQHGIINQTTTSCVLRYTYTVHIFQRVHRWNICPDFMSHRKNPHETLHMEYLQIQAHACQWAEESNQWLSQWCAACLASSSAPCALQGLFCCSQSLWDRVVVV